MKQFTLTRAGISIRLGQEIGRGGEGTVFVIEGQSDRVAKIYSTDPDQRKIQKLVAMAEVASPALLRIAAWPIDLLANSNGGVRGFVMPRIIARRDIHELYSPKSRSEAFPEADFRFLVHVGANIARAFAVIHEHGHILGDVNHGNLLVGSDGTVVLIDCDSFQIGTGSNVFTCDVGVPLFTAPELHGRSFRNLCALWEKMTAGGKKRWRALHKESAIYKVRLRCERKEKMALGRK
jgi:DNA-binding helix-hairpin-helix protein with protein kinase domain